MCDLAVKVNLKFKPARFSRMAPAGAATCKVIPRNIELCLSVCTRRIPARRTPTRGFTWAKPPRILALMFHGLPEYTGPSVNSRRLLMSNRLGVLASLPRASSTWVGNLQAEAPGLLCAWTYIGIVHALSPAQPVTNAMAPMLRGHQLRTLTLYSFFALWTRWPPTSTVTHFT
jgi:hypothetical protein